MTKSPIPGLVPTSIPGARETERAQRRARVSAHELKIRVRLLLVAQLHWGKSIMTPRPRHAHALGAARLKSEGPYVCEMGLAEVHSGR